MFLAFQCVAATSCLQLASAHVPASFALCQVKTYICTSHAVGQGICTQDQLGTFIIADGSNGTSIVTERINLGGGSGRADGAVTVSLAFLQRQYSTFGLPRLT